MVLISEHVTQVYQKCKGDLNFSSKTDDEFMVFILSTVVNMVDTLRPVFLGKGLTQHGVQQTGMKKRLNVDRFPSEQVNKITDTSCLSQDIISSLDDGPCSPSLKVADSQSDNVSPRNTTSVLTQTPSPMISNLLYTPKHLSAVNSASRDQPSSNLSSGSTYKFFSDIVNMSPSTSPTNCKLVELTPTQCSDNPVKLTPTETDIDFELNKEEMRHYPALREDFLETAGIQSPTKSPVMAADLGCRDITVSSFHSACTPEMIDHCDSFITTRKNSSRSSECNDPDSDVALSLDKSVCYSDHNESEGESVSNLNSASLYSDITDCRDKGCMYCPSYDPNYKPYPDLNSENNDTRAREDESLFLFQSALGGVGEYQDVSEGAEKKRLDENLSVNLWEEWSMLTAGEENSSMVTMVTSPTIIVPQRITKLSDCQLRAELVAKGALVGPITPLTRSVYEKYLVKIGDAPEPTPTDPSLVGYTRELISCLKGEPQTDWSGAEEEMSGEYRHPNPGRKYRQGTSKSCFNYLLLDPTVADDLPKLALTLNPRDIFRLFIKSIFYIGKGKQSRPYSHLMEANQTNKDNEKLATIRDIWSRDRGVVSLHVYHNTMAEEAFTREALMISCIGLRKLTNSKKGEFYGKSKSWRPAKQRGVGLSLLYKAHLTLLNEGHREIKRSDVV